MALNLTGNDTAWRLIRHRARQRRRRLQFAGAVIVYTAFCGGLLYATISMGMN